MSADRLIGIAKAAEMLDVCEDSLRRWDANGTFKAEHTPGGHRKYRLSEVEKRIGVLTEEQPEPKDTSLVAVYCRVSSHDQKEKGDLDRQKARVLQHCVDKKYTVVEVFEETGSGMNDTRPKLHRMVDLAVQGKISKVIVEHCDRLTRFNFKLVERLFTDHGVSVECIEAVLGQSFEAELVKDMLTLMASFSAKIYGKRSANNRKAKEALAAK